MRHIQGLLKKAADGNLTFFLRIGAWLSTIGMQMAASND